MTYRELFGEMVDTIFDKETVDSDIEMMSEPELKELALEKTKGKGVATKRARMAQKELYERTHY